MKALTSDYVRRLEKDIQSWSDLMPSVPLVIKCIDLEEAEAVQHYVSGSWPGLISVLRRKWVPPMLITGGDYETSIEIDFDRG